MTWRHALTRRTDPKTGEVEYSIREIYAFGRDDLEHPDSWTEDPLAPVGSTVSELMDEIRRYDSAATNPRVFDVDTREWVQVPPTTDEDDS